MLIEIEKDTYLNIKNVAFLTINEKKFGYTAIGSQKIRYVDFGFISRDDFIDLFKGENTKQFIGLNYMGENIYINVEAIIKVQFEAENDGIKAHIWFVNDEAPFIFVSSKDEEFIDKFIKETEEKLGEVKAQYVDHF